MAYLFLLLAAIQIFFLLAVLRLYLRDRNHYCLLALPNLLGLVLDNLIVGLGNFLGAGATLQALNTVRFVFHALFLPLLIIFAFGVARRVGVGWAQSKIAHALFCLLATALLALGAYKDIILFEPRLKDAGGVLRYVNAAATGPPLPAIITIIVMLAAGAAVWRKTGAKGMFIGALLEFLLAPFSARQLLLGNLGEIAFSAAIVAAERVAQRKQL